MRREKQLKILHHIPGRLRCSMAAVGEGPPNLNRYLKLPGVQEVMFNPITNSLLIVYDRQTISEREFLRQLRQRLPGVSITTSKKPANPDVTNDLSVVLYTALQSVNASVNKSFRGAADLTSLLPILLLLWGVEELIRRPITPRWYDLFRMAESPLSKFADKYLRTGR